ncbi:MAG: hypothetical protein QOH67_2763 [Hyphomicrobiales bacterium]|jgi:hypothetical protein|nr:hypothetical protein [Hyphomicrobiales bacterium]
MRSITVAAIIGALVLAGGAASAGPLAGGVQASTELSAQARRPPARLRVYPGRLLYRDCTFRLAQQWRPSGTVIVPVQRCWWVRG